ncbi:probable RNA methyltransferase CG11342 [Prorops nasuta]|uniref:probable RNA methyltransferase CG11342 n=1 Tax=Prorops nasuta TaxID=863751 RepID=UPI0034CFCFE1
MLSEVSANEASAEAEEKRTDPGASRHGNFMNYYQFHPAEERVRLLPRGVWRTIHSDRKYIGLDVGCNAGDLTYELQKFFIRELPECEISLLGVDLDPLLIERARERNPHPDRTTFQCLNFLSEDHDKLLTEYLVSLQRSHFDVIFCFSITMWIHLNYGDEGLERFFRKATRLCYTIVVEPQSWKCYRNASRRLRRARTEDFPMLNTFKYKGDMAAHIRNILEKLCSFKKVAETQGNQWQRKIFIYRKEI